MGFDPTKSGYVDVATRHSAFVEDHPDGRIETKVVQFTYDTTKETGMVLVEARVWKDGTIGGPPDGTGLSQMRIPGLNNFSKNSEVENAETSAIGRALGWIGYHPKEQIASKDEIRAKQSDPVMQSNEAAVKGMENEKATQGQLNKMFAMAGKINLPQEDLKALVRETTGKFSTKQLTQADMDTIYTAIESLSEALDNAAPIEDADTGVEEENPLA